MAFFIVFGIVMIIIALAMIIGQSSTLQSVFFNFSFDMNIINAVIYVCAFGFLVVLWFFMQYYVYKFYFVLFTKGIQIFNKIKVFISKAEGWADKNLTNL